MRKRTSAGPGISMPFPLTEAGRPKRLLSIATIAQKRTSGTVWNMRIHALVLIVCIALPAVAAQDERKKNENIALDRVVAVVNSEVVTRLDLDEQVKVASQ